MCRRTFRTSRVDFWSVKTDLFFIVHSNFWVTIQVELGGLGFLDCRMCGRVFRTSRVDIFWSIKTGLFFIVNSSFWVTVQVGLGEFGFLDCGVCRRTFRTSRVDFWSIKTDLFSCCKFQVSW